MINIQHSMTDNGILVFTLKGDLKIVSSEESKGEINSTISTTDAKKVVLDLNELTFLDSAGLAVFISAYKQLAMDGGTIAVCGLQGQPKTIFEISNMQKIIDVHPTLDEALGAFG
jgi:stage II sporulation protein AA (anti-sigma F factor antagonist)